MVKLECNFNDLASYTIMYDEKYPIEISTQKSACFDCRARIEHAVTLNTLDKYTFPLGISWDVHYVKKGYRLAIKMFARSGLSCNHGLILANGVGVIDEDYTGEISATLINCSNYPIVIRPSDRIAQAHVEMIMSPHQMQNITKNKIRNDGGHGSTGRS